MMGTGTILFLLGTIISFTPTYAFIPTVGTEIVITKNKSPTEATEYLPPSPGAPPFISNFIQKGTNVFFKPQFMLSSAHIPPSIQALMFGKNCFNTPIMAPHSSKVVIDEPVKITEAIISGNNLAEVIPSKIMEIKQSLVTVPKPVVPVIVEETPKVLPEILNLPTVAIEMKEKNYTNPFVVPVLSIPIAPVLPPFSIPELPATVIIEAQEKEEPNPALPEEMVSPIVIPEAPVLPPFLIPEFPAPIVIKPQGKATLAPALIEKLEAPVVIPEAPVLPPFSMPELPTPVVIEPHEKAAPVPVIIEETVAPVVIPEVPILPQFSMPELPTPVIIEAHENKASTPTLIQEAVAPLVIPEAPVLPAFSMPELPVPVIIERHEKEAFTPVMVEEPVAPIVIPEAPILPPLSTPEPILTEHFEQHENKKPNNIEKPLTFSAPPVLMPLENPSIGFPMPYPYMYTPGQVLTTSEKLETVDKINIPTLPQGETRITIPAACAQNIVIERVLPNISGQQGIQVAPALSSYPVLSPYLPTIGYRPF